MFGIKYDTWKNICNMYFSLSDSSLKSYLQWFPFTKLSNEQKEQITSFEFYTKYIDSPAFIFFSKAMHQSENFLQKSDGSFRDSSLVSPLLYLVLQAIGKEIHDKYISPRPINISVYYAGNYDYWRPKYKQDYDDFFKDLNSSTDQYQFFIKTDITNFYSNISIDKLMDAIDCNCNSGNTSFSQTQLSLYKQLLLYCGNGRFPLIENSIASSYLATVVYLDAIDCKLNRFIKEKITSFTEFRIVRYVDDMYILISSDKSIEGLHNTYNEIRNEYSSILKEYGLSLNTKKCCLRESKEINVELKKSLYDEYFNGEKHNIEENFTGALLKFIKDLSFELLLDSIDIEKYNHLIDKHFSSNNIEFTPSEVLNYFIYENNNELISNDVINEIVHLVNQSISFINLDPKRLSVMIMKTKNEKAIKAFLNQLFERNRENKWNSYDTNIAISYLIQSQFRHIDLLKILSNKHPKLYEYYYDYCKKSFLTCLNSKNENDLCSVISNDQKTHYLYFMYVCEIKRCNLLAAFAYYKNFFDRTTAILEFKYDHQPKDKHPNFNKFFKEKSHKNFYSKIKDSNEIIERAHKYRNSNPLSHASSELIDNDSTTKDLENTIKDLGILIELYIQSQKTE